MEVKVETPPQSFPKFLLRWTNSKLNEKKAITVEAAYCDHTWFYHLIKLNGFTKYHLAFYFECLSLVYSLIVIICLVNVIFFYMCCCSKLNYISIITQIKEAIKSFKLHSPIFFPFKKWSHLPFLPKIHWISKLWFIFRYLKKITYVSLYLISSLHIVQDIFLMRKLIYWRDP